MAVFGSNEELINRIKEGIEMCKTSQQDLPTYEKLLDDARELYERVLLIRYKAMELSHEASEMLEQKEIPTPKVEEPYVNAAKEEIPFSLFGEIETSSSPDPVFETPSSSEVPHQQEVETEQHEPIVTGSLEDEPEDFVSSMQKSGISSLNEGLDLNSRIRLVKHLFDGDSSAFASAIDELDQHTSKGVAMEQITQLKARYSWSEETEEYQLLNELIERRYRS